MSELVVERTRTALSELMSRRDDVRLAAMMLDGQGEPSLGQRKAAQTAGVMVDDGRLETE